MKENIARGLIWASAATVVGATTFGIAGPNKYNHDHNLPAVLDLETTNTILTAGLGLTLALSIISWMYFRAPTKA